MPYTREQCAVFGMMASGKKKGTPPKDWKKYCKGRDKVVKALANKT